MGVLRLNSRDIVMSHSISWSSVVRSSRRSIPVEFLSDNAVLDEDHEIKDAKTNMMQWINIFDEGSWIKKIVIDNIPSVFLPHVLNLGTRFLFSGNELSQP